MAEEGTLLRVMHAWWGKRCLMLTEKKKVFLEGIYVVVLVGGSSDEDERRVLIFIEKSW